MCSTCALTVFGETTSSAAIWAFVRPLATMEPMLFDQMFMTTLAPNRYQLPTFYALHAWIWEPNSVGTFAPFNRAVSC